MNPVFLPWLLAVALVSADDVVNNHHLPVPSRFLASFVAFGILAGLADSGQLRAPAVAVAWGLDIAMAMSFAGAKAPVLTAVGDALAASGKSTPGGTLPAPASGPKGSSGFGPGAGAGGGGGGGGGKSW